jgi:ribonuclease HI
MGEQADTFGGTAFSDGGLPPPGAPGSPNPRARGGAAPPSRDTFGGTTPPNPPARGGTAPPSASGVVIYTDGACSGNPGPGGWGVVLGYGDHVRELHGGDPETTNNRMELMAAIQALEALTRPVSVKIYTDSRYVLDGITKWLPGWQRNGWRTSSKQPVKNLDLWQRLVAAMAPHEVTWAWVKGHAGDPGNERADELARLGISDALGQARPAQ